MIIMPESINPSQNPTVGVSMSLKAQDNDLYKFLLDEKEELHDGVIEFLAKRKRVMNATTDRLKSKTLNMRITITRDKREEWELITPDAEPLMDLDHAMEVADYIAMRADRVFSTTYISPTLNTAKEGALIGLMVSQMLDNPRYHFKGNETDVRALVIQTCSLTDKILKRSIGAQMLKEIAENTVNQQIRNISEISQPQAIRNPSPVEKYFLGKK